MAGHWQILARAIELALLGYALERFIGALDAILVVVAFGGKQLNDPIGVVGSHVANGPGREVDRLTDLELVLFQRCLLNTNTRINDRRSAPSP